MPARSDKRPDDVPNRLAPPMSWKPAWHEEQWLSPVLHTIKCGKGSCLDRLLLHPPQQLPCVTVVAAQQGGQAPLRKPFLSPSVLKCRGWQPAHPRPSAVISQAKEEHVKVSLAQLSAGAGVDFKLQSESCRLPKHPSLSRFAKNLLHSLRVLVDLPSAQTYSQAAVFSQYPGLHVAHWLSTDRSSCFLQLAQASPMPTLQVIGMHSSLSDRT